MRKVQLKKKREETWLNQNYLFKYIQCYECYASRPLCLLMARRKLCDFNFTTILSKETIVTVKYYDHQQQVVMVTYLCKSFCAIGRL